MNTALIALAAVLLDWLLGEPKKYHPLVGFGWLAQRVERIFYGEPESGQRRIRGLAALCFLVVPAVALATYLSALPTAGLFFQLLALYFAPAPAAITGPALGLSQAGACLNQQCRARRVLPSTA